MKILLFALVTFFSLASVHAERVALVIGNNKYNELPERMQLTSPVADAKDVAAALKSLGYTLVTEAAVTDASRDSLTAATEKFATLSKSAEAAVFYYSGHGIQVGDDNYLLPTDTPKLTGISMLKNRGVLLRDSVMVAQEEAGAKTKIIILDCCRDNPFSAQLEQALAQVGKSVKTKSVGEITGYGPGFYLAFATSPGSTAADGNGARNSPFTAAMLKTFSGSAAKDIDFFFRDVKSLLPDDQVSWTNHSIKGAFSLGTPVVGAVSSGLTEAEVQRRVAELMAKQTGSGVLPGAVLPMPKVDPVPANPVAGSTPLVNPSVDPLDNPQNIAGKGLTFTVNGPNGEVKLTVRSIPSGSFLMGSPSTEEARYDYENGADGKPAQVTFSKPYWMGETEVTQSLYAAVLGQSVSNWKSYMEKQKALERSSFGDLTGAGADQPMYFVSANEVDAFIKRLNERVSLGAKWKWALPREAQWEYSCRAGTAGPYAGSVDTLAWYSENSGSTTHVVGTKTANAWGLKDMHGNVYEWCLDTWDSSSTLPGGNNPLGANGWIRVLRGGAWFYNALNCRSADRGRSGPMGGRCGSVGFRVAAVSADE